MSNGGTIETATIMFVDVVGSTAQRARVGENEAERLRLATDAIVNGAVADNGGVVVKHLGDGAMAKFAGAAGAIEAAVAMQQKLDRFNREGRGEDVEIRIGISAGDVTAEADDYFGLPVVEAQRLESSAEPGTIRCAEMVKMLGRGRGDHVFTELGDLELKGLAEPVRAHEVSWEPLALGSAAPNSGLPPILALAGGLPFSGRAEALGELEELAKACAHEGFATAFVAGEPGIGKTRLAHELAIGLTETGWHILAGRCDEDVVAPFQALRQALDWVVDHSDGLDVGDFGEHPGELVRLRTDLADHLGPLPAPLSAEPEAERYRLLQAVESWLRAAATTAPVLLVLDDLHWADKGTLVLLQHLIRSAPPGVLIVCTYRDTDVDRVHPLSSVLADLRRLPGVKRIALTGLPSDEIREFLQRAGGHELDDTGRAFAEIVERETAGNPFFVGELLRHLAETGLMVHEEGRWTGDLEAGVSQVPEGIREVVGRRLGRLGDEVEDVLRAASVIGYEFNVDLLAEVMGQPDDDVVDALDVAVAANIAVEIGVDRFRFSHALVRETLHDELSSTRRARQHRKVATAMERLHDGEFGPALPELAAHWREATVGGDQSRAIELAVQVGRDAMASVAPDTAASWFATAVEMMEDDDEFDVLRRETMVELAEAQIRSGDPNHVATTRRAATLALDAGDGATAAAALTLRSRTSFSEFDQADETKIALVRRALGELDLTDLQAAELTGELASELIFTRDISGRAEALRDFEDRLAAFGLETRAALRDLGRVSQKCNAANVELMAEVASSPSAMLTGVPARVFVSCVRGDGPALDLALSEWVDRVAESHPFAIAESVTWRVPILVLRGELAEAERTAEELLALMRELQIAERSVYRATTMLCTARERGTHTDLIPRWEAPMAVAHRSSATAAALAWLYVEAGHDEKALGLMSEFDANDVPDDAGHAPAIAFMAEVAARVGDASHCSALLEHCDDGAGLQFMTGGIAMGSASRLSGLLRARIGKHDEAFAQLHEATEECERLRSPTFGARTHLDIADLALSLGDSAQAGQALDAAGQWLEGYDLPALQARLEALRSSPNA